MWESLEIFPLSFDEIVSHYPDQEVESLFVNYIQNGGMPAKFQFEDLSTARNYLSDMYRSILLKDIVLRYAIRDVELLERFLGMASSIRTS